MSDAKRPKSFLLRPESIGQPEVRFPQGATVLSPKDAPEPRSGNVPAIARIFEGDGANLILMTFTSGQVLRDHRSVHPITVECVEGRLSFVVGEETFELVPGTVIHLREQVVHRVDCPMDAPERNVLLLTMLTGERQL